MKDQESRNLERYVAWGLVGLIILVGASIATSIALFSYRSAGSYYPIFPFFPFHFGLIGIIILVLLIFWVSRWWFWSKMGSRPVSYLENGNEADDILRKRYAKGEITKEHFEQMRRDLKQLHD